MRQLELKPYAPNELAKIMNLSTANPHFARTVLNTLKTWGYECRRDGRSFVITRIPSTIEERIQEILVRYYNIDARLDCTAFALYYYCMYAGIDNFNAAPCSKKLIYLYQQWGLELTESTLYRWNRKLLDRGLLVKETDELAYWTTYTDGTQRFQEEIPQSDPARLAYWEEYGDLIQKDFDSAEAIGYLWDKYHHCYYRCQKYSSLESQELIELCAILAVERSIKRY